MHTYALPYTNTAGKKGFEGDILSLQTLHKEEIQRKPAFSTFFSLHFHCLQDLLACFGKRNRIFIVNLSCIPTHVTYNLHTARNACLVSNQHPLTDFAVKSRCFWLLF